MALPKGTNYFYDRRMKILIVGLLLSSLALAGTRGRKPSAAAPLSPVNGVIEILNPAPQYSDIYAISDVHGMNAHQLTLLTAAGLIDSNQKWAAKNSLLVIVGDSIDKGPNSIEVVDFWMGLQNDAQKVGGRVVHLLGNHEAEFLADPTNDKKAKELLDELKSKGLDYTDFSDPSQPHGAFLRSEALAARVGNWLFCHAGLYPTMKWNDFKTQAQTLLQNGSYGDPFITGDTSILEAKDWWKDDSARASLVAELASNGMVGVVQGHQPSAYNIVDAIGSIQGGKMIRIDTGMAPDAGSNPGMILHFTKPAQLMTQNVPDAEVIKADGTRTTLTATPYDPTKFHPDTLE
jgi:hypothetical protein